MGTKSVIVAQTRNQLNVDTEVSRIFVFNNATSSGNLVNTSGAELSLLEGTLLGVIASTGKLEVMKSAAVDGSQLPVGILVGDITLAIGANADVNYVVTGDVVEERLIFDGADDLDTVITPTITIPELTDDNSVSGGDKIATFDVVSDQPRTYRTLIQSNTVGVHLVKQGDNLTDYNNS